MTRDEILNMPAGEELDALIAERVMEHSVRKEESKYWEGFTTLAHYSTDIAAAWHIVNKHPHYFSLVRSNETGWRPSPWGPTLWRCRFYAPEKFEAIALTAPLAICRAALLSVQDA